MVYHDEGSSKSHIQISNMILPAASAVLFAHCVSAREIIFPPVLGLDGPQQLLGHDDIDIVTGSQFNGLTTFANLPYVNCFTDGEVDAYDLVILGSPFDTVSAS